MEREEEKKRKEAQKLREQVTQRVAPKVFEPVRPKEVVEIEQPRPKVLKSHTVTP